MISFEEKSPDEEFQIPKYSRLNDYEKKVYKLTKLIAKVQTKAKSKTLEQNK